MKNFLQSKTIWGAIVMIASTVVMQRNGTVISEGEQVEIVNTLVGNVSMVAEAIGGFLVVWGRFTAKKGLKLV